GPKHDRTSVAALAQFAEHVDAGTGRHLDVQDQHVGVRARNKLQRFGPAGRAADHLVPAAAEQGAQRGLDHRVVVSKEDSGHCPSSGIGTTTRTVVASPSSVTDTDPPISVTRSRMDHGTAALLAARAAVSLVTASFSWCPRAP